MNKVYMCIDLKSFYASVECVERGLDPLKTNLVVADESRTDKTVCLAITPPLKSYGLGGRARLYEVKSKIREVNRQRKEKNGYHKFIRSSYNDDELKKYLNLELDFIIAPPNMNKYMEYSCNIYKIYLKYLSKDDIFVYSIDEVFCDLTPYLKLYNSSPREIVSTIIRDVYDNYGITATAGIGTNLYLAKVAMDIVAKHSEPNSIGVRIAELDEMSYRKTLWNHKPLTSFWRVGPGSVKRLADYNIYTMGDICKCSLYNENLLYKLFGVNAELLIDHAWGFESATIRDVKNYKSKSNSLSVGQVLHSPYNYEDAKVIVMEMADALSNRLVEGGYVTKKIALTIFYDVSNLSNNLYKGDIVLDHYGRMVPKPSHSSINLDFRTSSYKVIRDFALELYEKIVNPNLFIRKLDIASIDVTMYKEEDIAFASHQLNIFSSKNSYTKGDIKEEKALQETILDIKNRFGKNAILKGTNLLESSTMKERNLEVGGHRG